MSQTSHNTGPTTAALGRCTMAAAVVFLGLASAVAWADSRLNKATKKETSKTLTNTLEVKKTISLPFKPKVDPARCEAELSVSYSQVAASAKADTRVSVSDCTDAEGVYIVKVRSVAGDGTERTQEFREPWHLTNGSELSQTHTYDLLGDPDLRSLRIGARSAERCHCNRRPGASGLTPEPAPELTEEPR